MKMTVLSPHRDDAAFPLDAQSAHGSPRVMLSRSSTASQGADIVPSEIWTLCMNRTCSPASARCAMSKTCAGAASTTSVVMVDLKLSDAPQRLQSAVDDVCGFAAAAGGSISRKDTRFLPWNGVKSIQVLESIPRWISPTEDFLTSMLRQGPHSKSAAQRPCLSCLPVAVPQLRPEA